MRLQLGHMQSTTFLVAIGELPKMSRPRTLMIAGGGARESCDLICIVSQYHDMISLAEACMALLGRA